MNISVEQLIFSNYVRYDRLKDIVNSAFNGSNATKLNIYIDLYSILKPIYNDGVRIENYNIITSMIINMCAHYRDFFKTRYATKTEFYIIYSENCPYINNQFCKDYNYNNFICITNNKFMHNVIAQNIILLDELCKYLPDIHFIQTTFESGVLIEDLIIRELNSNTEHGPHMIISKDKYLYQLAALSMKNVIILRPKKYNKDDISYYINGYNLIDTVIKERKIKYRPFINLNPGLLSLLYTLTNCDRNFKLVINTSAALKVIETMISNMLIPNSSITDINNLYDSIEKVCPKIVNHIDKASFINRFKAIDINIQHMIFTESIERNYSITNLYDPESVKIINNKYFTKNPLDLNRL